MSDQSAGPGYWQASDGKWYPPESHPDAIANAAPQAPAPITPAQPATQPDPQTWAAPPTQTPPGPGFQAPGSAPHTQPPGPQSAGFGVPGSPATPESKSFLRRPLFLVAVGLVALLGIAVVAAVALVKVSSEDATEIASSGGSGDTVLEDDVENSDSDESDNDASAGETEAPSVTTIDLGDGGSSDSPWAFSTVTPIIFNTFGEGDGSAWNVTIGPIRDATAEILAENDFNDPPPEGAVFAAFDVELMLIDASKEPLSVGFNFEWEIIGGATFSAYDILTIETEVVGCGTISENFNDFSEAFAGGTLTGTICIPIPAEDIADPATSVALKFGEDRIYFAADGTTAQEFGAPDAFVRSDPSADRDGSRLAPWIIEQPSAIVFDSFGDGDGSIWEVTIGPVRDITAEVLAENSFNDDPAEGIIFAGFEVEMTLTEATAEPLSVGFNMTWEITGGETALAYKLGTIGTSIFGCGVTPNQFDDFAEVFVGGTVTGTVCIPIPAADLGHPNTEISLNFFESRVYFGP